MNCADAPPEMQHVSLLRRGKEFGILIALGSSAVLMCFCEFRQAARPDSQMAARKKGLHWSWMMSAEKCKNVRGGGKSHSFLGALALVALAHGALAAGPSLLHRWSFNGDYADSVGGADFTGTERRGSN